ncbi:hypothetical protein KY290_002595 [Solanum tuberosum]|uniref:Uncharacterized protein n=1 Tax=Solanum tuberosum TaxID=4113 RepID=A0ABQ7WQH4_SOLTU|nr:hypothetical protein KY290_002595 [Solanum tuberosum]
MDSWPNLSPLISNKVSVRCLDTGLNSTFGGVMCLILSRMVSRRQDAYAKLCFGYLVWCKVHLGKRIYWWSSSQCFRRQASPFSSKQFTS